MKKNNYSKYLFMLLLIIAILLVFLIVKPFITAIMAAILIAYITYPFYTKVNKLLKNRNLSALVVSILILLLITLPLFFILNLVSKEAYIGYIISKQKILSGNLFTGSCEDKTHFICSLSIIIKDFLSDPKTKYYLEDTIKKLTSYVVNNVSNLLFSIPITIINFFIMIFMLFYLFRDGEQIFKRIENLIPLKRRYKKHILKRINDVTHAVVYGQLLIAIAQGALGSFGFFIFGIHSPILWGVVMALLALLPWVGPPLIWLPAALFQIINGYLQADNALVTNGILLILYGTLIVGTIDNILRPKLIGEKASIHPVLALIGVIGGLRIFGFVGVFIGPIILAIFVTLVRLYEEGELTNISQ